MNAPGESSRLKSALALLGATVALLGTIAALYLGVVGQAKAESRTVARDEATAIGQRTEARVDSIEKRVDVRLERMEGKLDKALDKVRR